MSAPLPPHEPSGRTFIVVGDVQRTLLAERLLLREQNDGARRAVLNEIAQQHPAFVIMLGDLVARGDLREWQRFDAFTAAITGARIPLYAVLGNHDYNGDARALEHFFARFPELGGRRWSTIRLASSAIVLLDSNFAWLGETEQGAQHEWYRAELGALEQDAAIRSIVVCCHHPPYTNSMIVSSSQDVARAFVAPFLETEKGKLLFAGHAHAYEHFVHADKHFIVSGGGGGPRQRLRTHRWLRRHRDEFHGKSLRPFHFCRVTPEPDGVRVQMVALGMHDQWRIGDEFVAR
ncbi:MAG: metallophosphoesterase [Planctomycetota bacterium]